MDPTADVWCVFRFTVYLCNLLMFRIVVWCNNNRETGLIVSERSGKRL